MESPTDEDLARMDRNRTGKALSNKEWESSVDPRLRSPRCRMVGRTAYKSEHAVDLGAGAVEAALIHEADRGDASPCPRR